MRLADSALAVRFEPRRFEVGTGQREWFPAVKHLDGDTVSIAFAWPAEVVCVNSPRRGGARQITLFRADGKAVADKPAMQGTTGRDLAEPWIGSPLVVRLGLPALAFIAESAFELAGVGGGAIELNTTLRKAATPARAVKQADEGIATGIGGVSDASAVFLGLADVPALTLSGRPTSPRLKLYVEQAAGATLLWQAMLPGEQASVTLPATAVAEEWAPALEQLRKLVADAETRPDADPALAPLRLRLDIESDAPCTATLSGLALALETETELLETALRLAFSGDRAERQSLSINLPASGPSGSLRLSGRVAADNDAAADAAASPADGRRGALLGEGGVALQALDCTAPISLAGVALHWQPLSEQLGLRLRLLADSGGNVGTRVLAAAEATIATAAVGALALRWPALDLQAQRAWVEVSVSAGAGVWLFAGSGGPGWIENRNAPGPRQPLPAPLTVAAIPARSEGETTRAISVSLGAQTLAGSLPQGPFELTLAAGLPAAPASVEIVFTGAVRGSVNLTSARWISRQGA